MNRALTGASMKGRRYFGRPGHFIGAARCRFHLHTHVNGFCVSTVGEYVPAPVPKRDQNARFEEIGWNRLYETMVFKLGADGEIASYTELDMAPYNDAESADAGHEAMVAKYEALS